MPKINYLLIAGKFLWGFAILVSLFVVLLPGVQLYTAVIFGALGSLLNYFIPDGLEEAPPRQRRITSIVTTCLLCIIFFIAIVYNLPAQAYCMWHILGFLFLGAEMLLRIILIARPDKRLPEVFYPLQRKTTDKKS